MSCIISEQNVYDLLEEIKTILKHYNPNQILNFNETHYFVNYMKIQLFPRIHRPCST